MRCLSSTGVGQEVDELLSRHESQKASLRKRVDVERQQVAEIREELFEALTQEPKQRVHAVSRRQEEIDRAARDLLAESRAFSKQTHTWATRYQLFNDSLKEVGDVESWLRTIESEMKYVSTTLDKVWTAHKTEMQLIAAATEARRKEELNEKLIRQRQADELQRRKIKQHKRTQRREGEGDGPGDSETM